MHRNSHYAIWLGTKNNFPYPSNFFSKNFNNQKQPSVDVHRKSVLKICKKFTGEHPYRIAISIKLQSIDERKDGEGACTCEGKDDTL